MFFIEISFSANAEFLGFLPQLARARTVVETVSKDEELAMAIRDGDRAAIEARLENLVARSGAVRVRLELEDGQPVETGRGGEAVAPAVADISDAAGRPAGGLGR